MRYASLCAYYFVYYIINGFSAFLPKYYAELSMTDSLIGVLMSVPSLIALAVMPLTGILSDRVSRKRYLLAGELCLMGVACFVIARCQGFWPLLGVVSAFVILSVSVTPIATAISLEYCVACGRPYGFVRLMGTVGYQAGAFLVGILLSKSLKSLYPLMGTAVFMSMGVTFLMPNVEGHQHSRAKVPVKALFQDRHVCWLLGMILFATVSSQFFMSFFSKHLGDLGMSNTTVSWIMLLSVLPELPFLYFGDRIARRMSIWKWLIVGMLLNGVRWIGLAVCKTAAPIVLFQLLGVSVLGCFEFMPAFYLSRRVPKELYGSAQSMLTLTTFGLAKVIGGLLGGVVCERTGIPAVFAVNGVMLILGALIFRLPVKRLIASDDTIL